MLPLIDNESQLIDQMTTPSPSVVEAVSKIDGDIMILGVGGKMGPTLAELLLRAGARSVIGVSRFSDPAQRDYLDGIGVNTIRADLLDEQALAELPEVTHVFLLAGYKFGSTGNEPITWAMNTWLPGLVMQRFHQAKIIYVSSGNVYAYTDIESNGSKECGEIGPIGEYAQSRLGGERIAEYCSSAQDTGLVIVRLFYATELRYGIIHDIVQKIYTHTPIDLSMGHVNQIWQGDANGYLASMFPLCESPAKIINLTGPDVLSVREIGIRAGEILGIEPNFTGQENQTALLGDTDLLYSLYDKPSISVDQIITWVAHWISTGGRSLGKPTKYESRTGSF